MAKRKTVESVLNDRYGFDPGPEAVAAVKSGLKAKRVYRFEPVGMDVFDRRANQPARGTLVVKTQPHGCPRNGTMGHCYVEDATTGAFYGLVLVNSLVAT